MSRFIRQSDNMLTRYSHACGYLDSATACGDRMAVTLGIDGACYHVKGRPYNGMESEWQCFELDQRSDAVSAFRRMIRARNAKRNPNYAYTP